MNHRVPDFDMEEFYSAPSSTQSVHKNTQEDDIMELVWRNGQIGVQNHNHGVVRKSSPPLKSLEQEQLIQPPSEQPPPESNSATQLYIQEDEMTSWLHYPLDDDTSFDRNLTDLLYHPPPPPSSSVAPSLALPPADLRPPLARPPAPQSAVRVNFPHFARLKARVPEAGQSASSSRNNDLRDSAVVDSNDTPKSSLLPELSSAVKVSGGEAICGSGSVVGDGGGYMTLSRDAETCNLTLTSFGGSVSAATADLMTQPPADDRKRKGREPESQSEDLEIESCEARRQCPGSSSGKRSRATEVHNLSERKRRDRINERMKALQELIPRCCKTDKASMLDEAIEYLKSLQLQLQMMSMGYYGMFPMMFPGVQQYMPPVPPMGVGRGMETGISRPMMPFPSSLSGSQMATPGASSALGPRFPFPSFPAPPVPVFDPVRAQTNPIEMPTSADLYRQYLAALQMPVQQISQNRPASTPSSSKPSSSREAGDNENCPSGTG